MPNASTTKNMIRRSMDKHGQGYAKIVLDGDTVLISGGTAAAKAGGVKIFTFPTGIVIPHSARITGTLVTSDGAMTTAAGEIGLGSVVATGAIATLATDTFETILQGGVPALGNIGAAGSAAVNVMDGQRTQIPTAKTFATTVDVYLNAATTFADLTAANLVIQAGATIELWYQSLPA